MSRNKNIYGGDPQGAARRIADEGLSNRGESPKVDGVRIIDRDSDTGHPDTSRTDKTEGKDSTD